MHSRQPAFGTAISRIFLLGALVCVPLGNMAHAQKPQSGEPDSSQIKTFYLNGGRSEAQAEEVRNALGMLLGPTFRLSPMVSENAVSVRGTPEQIDMAAKLIASLDRPQRDYCLTYTLTEMDGSKRVGVQHYALVMLTGAHTKLKQGSKVPIVTGSTTNSTAFPHTQFTFVDVGINVDATLLSSADGLTLQSKMEQSGVIEDKSVAGISEPIIRQTILEGKALLQPGKPVALGSLDVPGSTRHLDVEVLLEPMQEKGSPARGK